VIVLDTSAMVEFLVGSDSAAEQVRTLLSGEIIAAPHAIDLECAAALRGLVNGKKLPEGEGEHALALLTRMDIRRYDHGPLLPRIWALRGNMWPYDAAYVALAELLEVELITLDRKFSATPRVQCRIRTIAR
jgi:predicted nucleic acid-binding protein